MNDLQTIVYEPPAGAALSVRQANGTLWLSQAQIGELFGVGQAAISKHIKNIYDVGEVDEQGSYSILEYLDKNIQRKIKLYNLDMILSIGYRVNSVYATQFRRWSNTVLKGYLMDGHAVRKELDNLSYRISRVETLLSSSLPIGEKIFFEGEVFDAYTFFCDRIREARQKIVLIDNYIDDTVLTQLDKRFEGVEAIVYTGHCTKKLQLDVDKHNRQYPPISIKPCRGIHDRFLIVDDTVYHVGASMKDAGVKMFAVMRTSFNPSLVLPPQ